MPARTSLLTSDTDGILAALDASGVVGVWSHDVWAGRIVVSDSLADVLGLVREAAGVSLDAFLTTILAEDRLRVENALHAAVEAGGPFEIAFRTVRGERRLGLRGRIDRGEATGRARGLGIAIDRSQDGASLHQPGLHAEAAANRMAEHAIALHDLAADLHQPRLAAVLDSLMREIAFTLAGHLEGARRPREH
ncbi:hypothetical protein [Methylobacterium sp. Leaf93]|uniref:hypothetical protein n=1 Tax=Methylobacterium sp. Leaf93 TaxID=1736249 RepID=UPI0006FF05EC|nr:hypothetical protein [Methylobacterium sp. Leaf93]KQP04700.1 hypothetical protein ASF26_11300 [Methylobacterium sp. Leaf93]